MRCQCEYLQMFYKDKELTKPDKLMCSYLTDFKKALVCEYKSSDKQAKLNCRYYRDKDKGD